MSNVFVIDTNQQPLAPVHPGHARRLLKQGQAAVWRRYPFTIRLKQAVEEPALPSLRLKIDPGSKTTGLAIVNDHCGAVAFAAELAHRGHEIKAALDNRRAVLRSRRARKTRYRAPHFANRRRRAGWLPPSLESRLANITTWVQRLRRIAPIGAISMELVRFDMQAMENDELQCAPADHSTSPPPAGPSRGSMPGSASPFTARMVTNISTEVSLPIHQKKGRRSHPPVKTQGVPNVNAL